MRPGPRITAAQPLEPYRIRLTFSDGTVGTVDLAPHIVGRSGVFRLLNEPAFFREVSVDREAGTIVWPNDVDLDPDVLYSELEPGSIQKAGPSAGRSVP